MGFLDLFKATENESLKRQVSDLQQQTEQLRQQLYQAQQQYSELEASVPKEKKDFDQLEERSLQLKTELNDLNVSKMNLKNQISQKTQELESVQQSIENLHSEQSAQQELLDKQVANIQKVKSLYEQYKQAIKGYEKTPDSGLNQVDVEEELMPVIEVDLNCMNMKELRNRYRQYQRDIQKVFKRYDGRYTTKANSAIYKLMVIAMEAELQNVLSTLAHGKLDKAVDSVKAITLRYYEVAVEGNQSIANTMKSFIAEIEYLFIESIKVEYEYYVKKQQEREEQKALKEQMKQEAEERRALEAEKKKIEKEESKYNTEIEQLTEKMQETFDEEKIRQLEERIAQLQAQVSEVQKKKDQIINLQNGKAGYVYVISNLGSFGENVFKVGMTRRQEPMDRIKELSNASVPFEFDVHSFIFSQDAVNLENTLHKELNSKRVNKVNLRKEFFRVSLDELEQLVLKHDPTAEFKRTMLAEQYYQSVNRTDVVPVLVGGFEDDE